MSVMLHDSFRLARDPSAMIVFLFAVSADTRKGLGIFSAKNAIR